MFINQKNINKIIVFNFIILLFISCRKDNLSDQIKTTPLTLNEAKSYFNNEILSSSPLTQEAKHKNINKLSIEELSKENDLLFKDPIWDKAYTKSVENGTAIAIPIKFAIKSFLTTKKHIGIDFTYLNYLLITKAPDGNMTAEWVTMYPDTAWAYGDRNIYTGKIVISDWDGNVKKGFSYTKAGKISSYITRNNKSIAQTQSTTYSNWFGSGNINSQKNSVHTTNNIDETEDGRIYKDPSGDCWENIREIPASEGTGVVLIRKKVDCLEDLKTGPGSGSGGQKDPKGSGGSGGGGGGDYPPRPCDPNPTKPANGTPYSEPCSGTIPFPGPIELTPDDDKLADHRLPNVDRLPPNHTKNTQVGATCTFKTVQWISKYLGKEVPLEKGMLDYAMSKGISYIEAAFSIIKDGIALEDLKGIIDTHFNAEPTTDIQSNIDAGHPLIGIIMNLEGGHAVMITGYNNDKTIEYFDPQVGIYFTTDRRSLSNIYGIQSSK